MKIMATSENSTLIFKNRRECISYSCIKMIALRHSLERGYPVIDVNTGELFYLDEVIEEKKKGGKKCECIMNIKGKNIC